MPHPPRLALLQERIKRLRTALGSGATRLEEVWGPILNQSSLESTDPALARLQIAGFLYTAEDLHALRTEFLASAEGLKDPFAFLQFLLKKAETDYEALRTTSANPEDKSSIAVFHPGTLGISLDQLCTIMNQESDTIQLQELPCHGRPNPFRSIRFKDKQGTAYRIGAGFDLHHVFRVHAYKTDAQGKRKFALPDDFPGWMQARVVGLPDSMEMKVADAITEALQKLADYGLHSQAHPAIDPEREAGIRELADALIRYNAFESAVDAMNTLEKEGTPNDDQFFDELFLYWTKHQKQHRIDKRRLESHLIPFVQYLLDSEPGQYHEILDILPPEERPALKAALKTVLRKYESKDLFLVGGSIEPIQILLKSIK
jgi:hypothetical protein